MGGGLLNLISKGSEDIILNGNPDISFFKNVYKKYSNYGSQYFRIDYTGLRSLNYDSDTIIEFTIPRHADLLGDTYFVINLPDIYSQPPIYNNKYCPKFKWIHDIGYNMIKKVTISIGGQKINEYSGEYFINLRDREYYSDKREKINEMTGNIPELYDPASKYNGVYPNAFKSSNFEPSIRGRKLYIPIDCWFGHDTHMHLPLVSLQYHEVSIKIDLRPIKELYVVANELSDEYTENFLFNEYPAMHNVNFLLKSKNLSQRIYCDDIKNALTENFKNYIDNIDSDMFDTSLYPNSDPLMAAIQEYTDSIISFVQNGDCNVPNTIQHTGTDSPDSDTDNVFLIRVHSIEHTNYYKVYIYIDTKRLSDIDNLNVFGNYLKTNKVGNSSVNVSEFLSNNIFYNFNNHVIMGETVSLFNSTDVQVNILPNSVDTINNFSSINVGFPNNIERNHYSNNRGILQDRYIGKNKNINYTAPDYISIKNINNSDDDTYDVNELIGQPQIDISYFTLDDVAAHLEKSWNTDMHLISKYIFLDDNERAHFAKKPQSYLIKTVYEEDFKALNVPNSIKINTKDLVINYMWNYKRSDVYLRNEWSNYTNWEFIDIPNVPLSNEINGITYPFFITPYIGTAGADYNNKKSILKSLSIVIDGKIRENLFEQGVFNNIEKYLKCAGQGKNGQYFYSFALNNNPTDLQPSGSMNMTRFKDISFEFTLIDTPTDPNFDPNTVTRTVLQTRPNGSAPICVSRTTKKDHIRIYSFDMKTFHERYNVLAFNSGMAGLMFAR